MEKEPLSFKNNACRIDLKVAGDVSKASGFVYITDLSCSYDYVLSAKHVFQEDINSPPCPNDLRSIVISYFDENGELKSWKMEDKEINENILFLDEYDLAIIKIEKALPPKAERIFVKNSIEVNTDCIMDTYSFPSIRRNMSTRITYKLTDKYDALVDCESKIQTISNFDGMSGSGIYLQRKPYLVSVIAGYSLPGFELKQFYLSKIDWDKVNDRLKNQGWALLDRGDSKTTKITNEQEVIDLRELDIRGATLNMEKAIKCLKHDLADDWYFDPLSYIDICNAEFVLDYFSLRERREQYEPQKLEEFYLPKRSLVLRKALSGTFIDRLVYMAVVCKLAPTIERHINKFVFSARYDRTKSARGLIVQGVEQWTKMNYLISDWIDSSNSGCLVKLDLLNYYDSINKQKLISLLKELPFSPNEIACIDLLNTWFTNSSKPNESHGIPQNSDASSLLATFYLSDVDEYIGSTAQHYCRFMDDMYFIVEDIYRARELMQAIEKKLRQIDLSLNSEKVKFIRLNNKKEKNDFRKELSLFDYDKSIICTLMKSGSKARRMNAVAMLIEQIGKSLTTTQDNKLKEIERNRALKFSINALNSYRLNLDSNWNEFYSKLKKIAVQQVDKPELITYFCRLVGSLNKKRDISDLKEIIINIVLRKKVRIYDWQAYHLWMLLAYLKCNDKRLITYAVNEIEKNDETRKVEIAAILIYMATINPKYTRTLFHKLRDRILHGNLQKRCALVACRGLNESVIDKEALEALSPPLKDNLRYLNKHKDKDLVLFHRISSYAFERNESVLFPESYYGL